jgi:hypothetical protein
MGAGRIQKKISSNTEVPRKYGRVGHPSYTQSLHSFCISIKQILICTAFRTMRLASFPTPVGKVSKLQENPILSSSLTCSMYHRVKLC